MEDQLPLEEAPCSISTVRQFEEVRQKVMTAIQQAIEDHVPLTQPCLYNNRWWTKDLSILRGKQQKLGSKVADRRQYPNHVIHEEYRVARADFKKAIEEAKQHCWKQWLETAWGEDIWKAHKMVTRDPADGGQARVQVLLRTLDNDTILR